MATDPTEPLVPGFAAPAAPGVHLAGRLLDARIVVVGGQIDDTLANTVCSQLLVLDALDPGKDITLYINSPGGSVDAGFAIYDTMRALDSDVATAPMALAASMGRFLLVPGPAGNRSALPHAPTPMPRP